jgi:hypothetical protein
VLLQVSKETAHRLARVRTPHNSAIYAEKEQLYQVPIHTEQEHCNEVHTEIKREIYAPIFSLFFFFLERPCFTVNSRNMVETFYQEVNSDHFQCQLLHLFTFKISGKYFNHDM